MKSLAKLFSFICCCLLMVYLQKASAQTVRVGVNSKKVNYGRPFEPSTHPAFIALPPGAVEPEGWLRDWCIAARDGYTGHMDEYGNEFTNFQNQKNIKYR